MTYSLPPESYRFLRPETPRPSRRGWDLVLSIVLLMLVPFAALAATYAGLFLAFAADACGAQTCDTGLMNIGFWMAVIAPWGILVVAVVVTIVRLVRHRVAFWVPLVAIVAMVVVWFIAAAFVGAGVSAS